LLAPTCESNFACTLAAACCGVVVDVVTGGFVVLGGGTAVVGGGPTVVGGAVGVVVGASVGGGGMTEIVGGGGAVVVVAGACVVVVVSGGDEVVVKGTEVDGGCVGTATLSFDDPSSRSARNAMPPMIHSANTTAAMMRAAVTYCIPALSPCERRMM